MNYLHPQASLKGRISKLQQTLDRVGDTTDRLRQLLAQLEGWRDGFEKHKPPRVSPGDVEKQIAKLAVRQNLTLFRGEGYVLFGEEGV